MHSLEAEINHHLINHFAHLQDRLSNTLEELELFANTLDLHFNTTNLIDTLKLCTQAIEQSKEVVKAFELVEEERDSLKVSFKEYGEQNERLMEQNQILTTSLEELQVQKMYLQSQLTETEKRVSRSKQIIEKEAKDSLQQIQGEFIQKIREFQLQCYKKDTVIKELQIQIEQVQLQLRLKCDELKLSEFVLQDLWNLQKQSQLKQNNHMCATYSPSIVSSSSQIHSLHSSLVRNNNRKNSLMQDLFESQLLEQEPRYTSQFNRSSLTIGQIEEEHDKITQESFYPGLQSRLSPVSINSHSKSIHWKMAQFKSPTKKYTSHGTQTAPIQPKEKNNNSAHQKSLIIYTYFHNNNISPTMKEFEKQAKILQFNQMHGVQSGKVQYKDGQKFLSGQRVQPLPGNYLLLEVESDGRIVQRQPAKMYDLRSTAFLEQQTETKAQKWSMQSKKNMVSQFGTNKSKRKINQMMNNIIQ